MSKSNKLIVYGAVWCPDTLRAIEFLNKQNISIEFKNIDEDSDNTKFVEDSNGGLRIIPTIVLPDNTIVTEPTNSELEKIITKFNL